MPQELTPLIVLKCQHSLRKLGARMDNKQELILDLYHNAQHCNPVEFTDFALSGIKKRVPFESAVVSDLGVQTDGSFLVHTLHTHRLNLERIGARAALIGAEKVNANGTITTRDVALRRAFAGRGRTVSTSIATTFHEPDILAYCDKFETAHSMTLLVNQGSRDQLTAVSIWRAQREERFTEADERFGDQVLAHMIQARQINQRLSATRATAPDQAVVLASENGTILFVDDDALRLLQMEWRQWAPPTLPVQLLEALRRPGGSPFAGRAITIGARCANHMLCLTVSANRKKQSLLTAAEHRVAALAARGLPYKEIAALAGVSPATVRNQLHTAYQKLGVTNKTALALALNKD